MRRGGDYSQTCILVVLVVVVPNLAELSISILKLETTYSVLRNNYLAPPPPGSSRRKERQASKQGRIKKKKRGRTALSMPPSSTVRAAFIRQRDGARYLPITTSPVELGAATNAEVQPVTKTRPRNTAILVFPLFAIARSHLHDCGPGLYRTASCCVPSRLVSSPAVGI